MKRRLIGKLSGYIVYSITTINKIYGDFDFVNPIDVVGDGIITYSSNNITVATVNQNTGQVTIVKPGIAVITASVQDSTNYSYETKNITYTLNIAKAEGNVSEAPVSAVIPYTGNPQQLVTAGTGTGTMYYKLDDGIWNSEIPTATNCGTYTIYYKSIENDYYTESSVGNLQVTIPKSAPDYIAPTEKVLIYNNSEQELLQGGSTSDGIIYYSLDNSTWNTNIPKGINAGTYVIYWKIVGDSNHSDVASTFITVSIDKVTPTVTAPTAKVLTYNGEPQILANAGSTDWGTMQYALDDGTYSTSVPSATDANITYKVWYKVVGNSNINDVTATSIDCFINEKKVTATVTLSQTSYTYDGNAKTPSVTVKDGSTVIPSSEYTVTYSNNINAGTATVTINDKTSGNYEVLGSATFTINKADLSASVSIANWTYGETASNPSVSGNSGGGNVTYAYKVQGADDSTYTSTKPSNAGNYTVRAIIDATNNYNGATVTSNFTINKAQGNASVSGITAEYNGTAQNIISVSDNTGTMHYRIGTEGSWTTTIPTKTNAGSNIIYYYMDESTNYTSRGNSSNPWGNVTGTITKITPVITNTPVDREAIYTGSEQNLLQGGTANISGSFSYSTATNVGTYTATWTFNPTDATNYNSVSGTVEAHIYQANPDIAASPSPKSGLVYNGSSQQLVNAGTVGNVPGHFEYRTNASGSWSSYSTTIPEATNAGSYSYYWIFYPDDSTNYYNVSGQSFNGLSIAKRPRSLSWTSAPSSVEPDDYPITILASANYGNDDGIISYSSSDDRIAVVNNNTVTGISHGTVSITANISEGINHESASITYTLTVPYDSKIEYLESTGTQWIDTLYKPNNNTRVICDFQFTQSNDWPRIFGCSEGSKWNTVPTFQLDFEDGVTTGKLGVCIGNNTGWTRTDITGDFNRHTYDLNTTRLIYDGTQVATLSDQTFQCTADLAIFTRRPGNSTPSQSNSAYGKLYSFQIYESDELVRFFIPVRIGQIGYMYDKISGQLFENSGTGNFVLGEDIELVEYFETTDSSSSINTKIIPNENTKLRFEFINLEATGAIIIGYMDGDDTKDWRFFNYNSQAYFDTYDGTSSYGRRIYGGSIVPNTRYNLELGNYYVKNLDTGTNIISGDVYTGTGNNNIYINGNVGATNNRWYYIKIYDGTTLVRDFVPAQVGQVSCMYDHVSGLVFKAGKLNQSAPTATGATTTYPTIATATASGGGGQGSLEWESEQSQTSVGSHTTRVRWSGNDTYDASDWSEYVTVKMNPRIDSEPTNANRTYNGSAQSLLTGGTASPSGGTWSYSTGTNAGTYTATWTFTLNGISISGSKTATISKADQNAPTASGSTTTYPTTATATASGGGEQGSIEWSNGNTQTSIGSKTTQARWSGNNNYNASPWSNSVTLTVNDPYNGHAYVDLGLPSGTKWATMNIGASSETEYGSYISIWSDGIVNSSWGGAWQTPTKEQWQELYDNCTKTIITKNSITGANFSRNNKNLFLPFAGRLLRNSMVPDGIYDYVGEIGFYGTCSTISTTHRYFTNISSSQSTFNYDKYTQFSIPFRGVVS